MYRTGLSKVGIPAAPVGMSEKLVRIAALLKEQGYATGQFGKNHLGDLNHMLPTNHGFDEFFGNLYHLNAEEDLEQYNYPPEKDFPNFRKNFGPRGVVRSWATDKDDDTVMERWGKVGKQRTGRARWRRAPTRTRRPKLYPLSQAADPPPTFVDASDVIFGGSNYRLNVPADVPLTAP